MLSWDKKDDYRLLVDALMHDEVVLAASDTVLGLFAQLSEKSKKRLDFIKQRNLKSYIILVQSVDQISDFTDQEVDESMRSIIDQYWPGPLTIIFKAKSTLPEWMIHPQGTVAIRVPDHEGLQKILEKVGALFTTSANMSDQPVPDRYNFVNPEILNKVKFVCCNQNKIYDGPASTIIDLSSGSIKIIRMGEIEIDSN